MRAAVRQYTSLLGNWYRIVFMLSPEEILSTYQHACVPEHIPVYVQTVSGADATLHENYLCYVLQNHCVFVGYPLREPCMDLEQACTSAAKRFRSATMAIIAASAPSHLGHCLEQSEDRYYRLELPLPTLPGEVAYMIRRAGRELRVCEGSFGSDHEKLIADFVESRNLGPAHQVIFHQIPRYLEASDTALLIEARKDGHLAAFDIVDFGSADYAFYMFNFRSSSTGVPGASDLLFYEMTRLAQEKGKQAINLGLGINPGVIRFKEKWGATPFLNCAFALIRPRSRSWLRWLTGH
jgi:hypothetical protein